MHAFCALCFTLFAMLYLTVQAPVLEGLQYILSEGKTSYNPWITTPIITTLLLLLAWGMYRWVRVSLWWQTLHYLPSVLVLAVLPHIDKTSYYQLNLWPWLFVLAVGCGAYALLLAIDRTVVQQLAPRADRASWSTLLSWNFVTLLMLLVVVLVITPPNTTFLVELKTDSLIRHGRYSEAMDAVHTDSITSTSELFALQAYALGRSGLLAERLFELPKPENVTSADLLPHPINGALSLDNDQIEELLGGKRMEGESNLTYLWRLCHADQGSSAAVDFYLCALLLDKELDTFVSELDFFYMYDEVEELPAVYRHALTASKGCAPSPVQE